MLQSLGKTFQLSFFGEFVRTSEIERELEVECPVDKKTEQANFWERKTAKSGKKYRDLAVFFSTDYSAFYENKSYGSNNLPIDVFILIMVTD